MRHLNIVLLARLRRHYPIFRTIVVVLMVYSIGVGLAKVYKKHEVLHRLVFNWHRYHETRKMLVLSHYGVAGVCRCVICGESRIACLSLDHLSGEGHSDRQRLAEEHNSDKSRGCSAHQMYSYVINNNFPDGYQTLCMNCQFVKRAENKEYYHA